MWFNDKNEKKAEKVEKKLRKLDNQIARLVKHGKDIGDLCKREGELGKTLSDISGMRANNGTEYVYGSSKDNGNKPETKATGENQVTMFTENGNIGNQIHETRHGGQDARGEINVATSTGLGIDKEVDAYKAQYSYSGSFSYSEYKDFSSLINSADPLVRVSTMLNGTTLINQQKRTVNDIDQITPTLVRSIGEGNILNMTKVYPNE